MREPVPQAVQDCHDLLRWLIPHLDKFPRARRFTLGERLEVELLDVLAELTLDRRFIHDSYACRIGKGVHAAVAHYFPSIDHAILKEKIRRHIKDREVLALVDVIVDTSPPQASALAYFPCDDLFRRKPVSVSKKSSDYTSTQSSSMTLRN